MSLLLLDTYLHGRSSRYSDAQQLSSSMLNMVRFPENLNLGNVVITREKIQNSTSSTVADTQTSGQLSMTRPILDKVDSQLQNTSSADEQKNPEPVKALSNSVSSESTVPMSVSKSPPRREPSSCYQQKRYPYNSIAFILANIEKDTSKNAGVSSISDKMSEHAKGDDVIERRIGGSRKGRVRHQILSTCC